MLHRHFIGAAFCLFAMLQLTACGGGSSGNATTATSAATSATATSAAVATSNAATTTSSKSSSTATNSSTSTSYASIASSAVSYSTHEAAADYTWDAASETKITFYDTSIVVSGAGASANKTTVTITAAGNYRFSGTLLDGQILVNTEAKDTVRLIFDGINIKNSTTAPVFVADAKKVVVFLASGTKNYLGDGTSYVYAAGVDEPNATLYSKANLTIAGTGELNVDANYLDGITSKDGLLIHSGLINVDALDDGIRGKDYLSVQDGTVTVVSGGDALKSDNEDAGTGIVDIKGGKFTLTATAGDAVSGETAVQITGGDFNVKAGSNGSSTTLTSTSNSMKGLKATANLSIFDGNFNVNVAEDALHANGNILVAGGTFNIAAGDDGAHADSNLTINGGALTVTKAYEGLEGAVITVNGGTTQITASDDGVNVAGGTNSETTMGGRPTDNFSSNSSYYLYINGGYLSVNSTGDGLDANGSIVMTGGTVIVNGPSANNNAALDYDGSFTISGGLLIAAGSSGMAQAPGTASTQNSVKITLSSSQAANKLIHIESAAGTELVTFAPVRTYNSIVVSSPNLVTGTAYDIYQGGTASGTPLNGLYTSGGYSGGTKATSFTPSSRVTNVSK